MTDQELIAKWEAVASEYEARADAAFRRNEGDLHIKLDKKAAGCRRVVQELKALAEDQRGPSILTDMLNGRA